MTTSLRHRSAEPAEVVLLKGLRQGDRDAFDALFERYFSRVLGLVARSGADPDTQRLVTQEVLEQLFDRLARTRDGDGDGSLAHTALALTCRALARHGLRLRG